MGELSPLDPEIRALLWCPVCKGDLVDVVREGAVTGLRCDRDRLVFPRVDGVLVMTPERARKA